MVDDDPLPADPVARLALLVSVVGFAGVLTLALMYAIEVPRGGPYVFGAINDALGGLYNLGLVPLVDSLAAPVGGSPGWMLLTRATEVGTVLAAASSFLLVAKVLPFAPSTAITVAGIYLQSGWLLGLALRRQGPLRGTAGLLRFARVLGIGGLVGLPLIGAGLLLPRNSPARTGAFAVGGALGGGAWAGLPVFWLLLGRALGASR